MKNTGPAYLSSGPGAFPIFGEVGLVHLFSFCTVFLFCLPSVCVLYPILHYVPHVCGLSILVTPLASLIKMSNKPYRCRNTNYCSDKTRSDLMVVEYRSIH
jgi:hypothetical protein